MITGITFSADRQCINWPPIYEAETPQLIPKNKNSDVLENQYFADILHIVCISRGP